MVDSAVGKTMASEQRRTPTGSPPRRIPRQILSAERGVPRATCTKDELAAQYESALDQKARHQGGGLFRLSDGRQRSGVTVIPVGRQTLGRMQELARLHATLRARASVEAGGVRTPSGDSTEAFAKQARADAAAIHEDIVRRLKLQGADMGDPQVDEMIAVEIENELARARGEISRATSPSIARENDPDDVALSLRKARAPDIAPPTAHVAKQEFLPASVPGLLVTTEEAPPLPRHADVEQLQMPMRAVIAFSDGRDAEEILDDAGQAHSEAPAIGEGGPQASPSIAAEGDSDDVADNLVETRAPGIAASTVSTVDEFSVFKTFVDGADAKEILDDVMSTRGLHEKAGDWLRKSLAPVARVFKKGESKPARDQLSGKALGEAERIYKQGQKDPAGLALYGRTVEAKCEEIYRDALRKAVRGDASVFESCATYLEGDDAKRMIDTFAQEKGVAERRQDDLRKEAFAKVGDFIKKGQVHPQWLLGTWSRTPEERNAQMLGLALDYALDAIGSPAASGLA